MDPELNLKNLLLLYSSGKISAKEQEILFSLLLDDENEAACKNILEEINGRSEPDPGYQEADWQPMIRSILNQKGTRDEGRIRKMPFTRKYLFRAASVVLLCGLGLTALMILKSRTPREISKTPTASPKIEIATVSQRATLYLMNGKKILLDTTQNGFLAEQGETNVYKTDSGNLKYAVKNFPGTGETEFNELVTPRGGTYKISLPDGTRAWLNAASSISFPTRFTGRKREVTIKGEVYFEVAKDAAHPFVVSLPALTRKEGENGHWMQVEVIGTHFNINNYEDDPESQARTTLLEGSVRISAHGTIRIIKPGEQAAASFQGTNISIMKNIDLTKVMAWKNGEIMLNNGDVKQCMREISRWYDVDIEYQGGVPVKKFYGSINRNTPLSSVLRVLNAYGIETRQVGKKIIIGAPDSLRKE